RKPGTSKKARAQALAVMAGRPPEVAVELLDPKERKALRRRLEEWTAESAFDYLTDLLDRAKKSGDLRAEIALLKDMIDRGSGTPRPEPEPPPFQLSEMIRDIAKGIEADREARPAPPALPPATIQPPPHEIKRAAIPAQAAKETDRGSGGISGDSPPAPTPPAEMSPGEQDYAEWLQSPEGQRASPELRRVNHQILTERPRRFLDYWGGEE